MHKSYLTYYSAGNFGDDLFVQYLVSQFDVRFEALSNRPSKTLRKMENLLLHQDLLLKGLNAFKTRSERVNSIRARELYRVRRNEIAIILGGSLFRERGTMEDHERLAHYASFGTPFFILGANVGPIHSKEYLEEVQRLFSRAEAVVLRDSYSRELVGDLTNVTSTTDLLFGLDLPSIHREREVVAISLINPSYKGYQGCAETYYRKIARFVVDAVDRGLVPRLLGFCRYEGDDVAIDEVMSLMPARYRPKVERHSYRGDLVQTLQKTLSAEYMLGTRFHAIILGLLNNMKVFPISYAGKLSSVLQDIGYSGPTISLERLDERDQVLSGVEDFQAQDVSHLRGLSRSSLTPVREFLNS